MIFPNIKKSSKSLHINSVFEVYPFPCDDKGYFSLPPGITALPEIDRKLNRPKEKAEEAEEEAEEGESLEEEEA
jgi:hypothetical protein